MRTTSLQERMRIVAMASAGYTDVEIAADMGWSVATIRKWRRRGERDGLPGLRSVMGRPTGGPLSSFSPEMGALIQGWGSQHPAWGPDTLRAELVQQTTWPADTLPSRSALARWRQAVGLTRPYERHTALPQAGAPAAQEPHEEWELDARGHQRVPEVGVVTLINYNDRVSRAKLLSYPCEVGRQRATRHPTTADYQLTFRLVASDWGLPDRLFVDRDSVFYDNTSKSPFPTRLHLWLLGLGVDLHIGPPRCPQKRGITERSHQTWASQVLTGQTFGTWDQLYRALHRRRDFLNHHLPCASLNDQPPLVAYPTARRPRREYRPEWELDLLNLARVHSYLADGQWFRKGSNVGAVALGGQRYPLGQEWAGKQVEITFDPSDLYLTFRSPAVPATQQRPIQGLSKDDLIGELSPLLLLPHYQLELPFTWSERRMVRLCETLGMTT